MPLPGAVLAGRRQVRLPFLRPAAPRRDRGDGRSLRKRLDAQHLAEQPLLGTVVGAVHRREKQDVRGVRPFATAPRAAGRIWGALQRCWPGTADSDTWRDVGTFSHTTMLGMALNSSPRY